MSFMYSKGSNPMKYLLNAGIAVISLVSVGALSSCNLYESGRITENKIQVREDVVTRDVALASVDDAFIADLARNYTKYSSGEDIDLIVTYDPSSREATAMKAMNSISQISGELRSRGIDNINAEVLPVNSLGDEARLLISYNAYSAHAPEGCDSMMPGLDSDTRLVNIDRDYKLGCSVQSLVARQVAKPSHLLGQGAKGGNTDGRAAANVVDYYRAGAPNAPLNGESASQ